MSELIRDFVGYGRHRPQFEWPGGKRLALSVVVNYEHPCLEARFLRTNRHELPPSGSAFPSGQYDMED